MDEVEKELNNSSMRLRELYGWHFPQLAKIVVNVNIERSIDGKRAGRDYKPESHRTGIDILIKKIEMRYCLNNHIVNTIYIELDLCPAITVAQS
ncbi:hypothetical protein RJ639_012747 [Escallonia herrerae]|uniref:Nop domain-containing protein n=1 Tax=Escallonia herrerae TaxID=1293975 RepID=A0AA88VMJ4_9ASTE|nr:hypothetical protein RJ639_012747 [Escallonia herrerae]